MLVSTVFFVFVSVVDYPARPFIITGSGSKTDVEVRSTECSFQ